MNTKQTEALRIATESLPMLEIAASLGDETGQISFHSSHLLNLIEGYVAARQEIASLMAQPYDQQAMGLCHVCGWKGVIDYPDGPVCVACEHDKTLSPQPTAQPLHVAATSCPHEIDKDKIVLHFDSKQPGKNALAQLAARLQAAQAQPAVQTQRTGLCCRSHPHEKQGMQCQLLEVSAWLRWHASACTTPSADSMRLYADQVDAVTGSLLDAPAQAAAPQPTAQVQAMRHGSDAALKSRLLTALERASSVECALRALIDECESDEIPGWEDRMNARINAGNAMLAAAPSAPRSSPCCGTCKNLATARAVAGATTTAETAPGAASDPDALRCAVGNCMFSGEVAQHAPTCTATGATAAPAQAAPVDAAVQRESQYNRGFRHGYNRRDAEVKGALA